MFIWCLLSDKAQTAGEDTVAKAGSSTDAYGHILDMLEVVQTDFARLEAETTTAEEQASSAFEELMNATDVDKQAKKTELKYSKAALGKTQAQLAETAEMLDAAKENLKASEEKKMSIEKRCSNNVTFEERVAQREAEIQSLKEVLQVLSDNNN